MAKKKKSSGSKAKGGKTVYPKGKGVHPERWQPARKAKKLPDLKGRAEAIQSFAVWAGELNRELLLRKSKHGFSIHHKHHRRNVICVGGSATTLRLASWHFDPDKDVGCEEDSKGCPTIVIEEPEQKDVVLYTELVLGRLGLKITKP